MKFGGTSLEDVAAFNRVARIIHAQDAPAKVVVVSAMSGVTDALKASVQMAAAGKVSDALGSLDVHFDRHLKVISDLDAVSQATMHELIYKCRSEIAQQLRLAATSRAPMPLIKDAIGSFGERLAANLLALVLKQCALPATYVDARNCVVTNGEHGNAEPLIRETRRRTRAALWPLLEKKKLPILEGFVGASRAGVPTTLGRGSSNYTATLVGAALRARKVQIWTDVTGVLTADPRLVKAARTVPQLSYAEARELASLGVRVLHPKMISPLLQQKISLEICNSRRPEESGTLVSDRKDELTEGVKVIAHKTQMTAIDIKSTPAFLANGFRQAIELLLMRHQTDLYVTGLSEDGASLACTNERDLSRIIQDLNRLGSVGIQKNCALVSCIGEGLHRSGRDAKVLHLLEETTPTLEWQGTSNISLVSVLDSDSVDSIVKNLHSALFEGEGYSSRTATGQA